MPSATSNWRNAKKKDSDDFPVIQAVSKAKRETADIPLKKFILAGQFSQSTFARYLHRAELGPPLWGPRGKPCAITVENDTVKAVLKAQWNGQRHRMPGVAEAEAQTHFSAEQMRKFRNRVREELKLGMAHSLISVEYSEPHLIWSMDIFEKWHHGIKFHVLQVIDLGSRIKLDPLIKAKPITGEEVADHINMLMRCHGAPLFLKRDNGGNLNSSAVFSIMNLFGVIAFNSPPGCPQFNGVMERSQGEVKRYLNVMCHAQSNDLDVFSSCVYVAIQRANWRKRPVLKGENAENVWSKEYLYFSKRERENIYNELKNLAAEMLNGFPLKKRNRKDAVACAWRQAVRAYLEEKGYIRLYRDGKPLRN